MAAYPDQPTTQWPDPDFRPTFVLSRTGSLMKPTDWVADETRRLKYRVVRFKSQLGASFVDPVSGTPSFLYRPASFMSTQKVVMDAQTDYVFARFRFQMRSKGWGWTFIDEAGHPFAEIFPLQIPENQIKGVENAKFGDLFSKLSRSKLLQAALNTTYQYEMTGARGVYARIQHLPGQKLVAIKAGEAALDRRLLALVGYLMQFSQQASSSSD